MKDNRILIIDDNKGVLTALELLLQSHFKEIVTSPTPNVLPNLLTTQHFDLILLDMNYSAGMNTGNEGIYWLNKILEIDKDASVIMITAYGDVELAVRAVKEGAVDFILKPWDNNKLIATISSALRLSNTKKELQTLKDKEKEFKVAINQNKNVIIGKSPQITQVLNMAAKVAKTDANVLITGENGTGKDLIANTIHQQSLRNNEMFVRIDMGAVAETLFESELFGYVKGAFTDAKEDRMGKFEIAKGGTLFLDEIANLSMPLQAKLLTALQTREIVRVGSSKRIPIDIRLICATNANLLDLVQEGNFREDLLYRINTIQIEVPALRHRKTDIPLLARFFLKKYTQKYKKTKLSIDKDAMNKLSKYEWHGNVRELEHSIEKAVILNEGSKITAADFFLNNQQRKKNNEVTTLEQMEKQMIIKCIKKNHNNLSLVAVELGITRQTLYNKIKKHKL